MTEYELADLVSSTNANSLVLVPLFISIVSGYLVVAWLVGSRLQPSQASLINVLFVSFACLGIFAWASRMRVALSYQPELLEINPDRLPVMSPWLIPATLIVMTIVTLGCLKFMWDIRHPKKE